MIIIFSGCRANGNSGDESQAGSGFILSVDKTNYCFKNKAAVGGDRFNSPIAIFDNDSKIMYGGKLYNISLVNNLPTLTEIYSVRFAEYQRQQAFISIDGRFYIEEKPDSRARWIDIFVYKIDITTTEKWPVLQQFTRIYCQDYPDLANKGTTWFNVIGNKGIAGNASNLYRYIKNIDTSTIAAIKYKNTYWYPTLQNLSATPADVTAGKTFIGASGIPEIGSNGGGEG